MSKIAIICDTHFGARGDGTPFLTYQKIFLDNVFFPYLRENNIKTIFHLGDLVDRRKYINFNTAKKMREDFLDPSTDFDMIIIAGNHDVYHKSTNEINAFQELLRGYPHIKALIEPAEIDGMLFLPWMNPENKQASMDLLASTRAQLCFGHLELSGFEMHRGHVADHGMEPSIFNKFDMVFSGHYHHKSTKGNINYLGSCFEMTWADHGDPRGFHILDTDKRELTFIENPYSLFTKIFYNDEDKDKAALKKQLDEQYATDVYCKVIVEKKVNPYLFDYFVSEVEKKNPIDLKIVEAQEVFSQNNAPIEKVDDTLTVLRKSVQESDLSSNKNQLEDLMIQLYNQAQADQI